MLYFRAMTAFNEETETVERWIKIGKTKKPARRENEYNVHNPVVKVIGTKTGYTKAEKAEHAKLEKLGFERKGKKGEWYKLPAGVKPLEVAKMLRFEIC